MNTAALEPLFSVLVDGDRQNRLAVSRLESPLRELFSDSLDQSSRLLAGDVESFRAHASLSALVRIIWSLVPSRVLTGSSPDFLGLASDALIRRFGRNGNHQRLSKQLAVIFKRIRRYARDGRQATSLDLELKSHQDLFHAQSGRCNHCLFEFFSDSAIYAAEDDGIPVAEGLPVAGELTLARTFRRPELDHIIPLILGGDSPENWQILCKSCNIGKSDHVAHSFTMGSRSYSRVEHLLDLTPGKRYSVIAQADPEFRSLVKPGDDLALRVFRRDDWGLNNPENLIARLM